MNTPGGTRGVLKGNLKKRLVSCTLAAMEPGEIGEGTVTFKATIRGMCKLLDMAVAVGAYTVSADGSDMEPLPPSLWPAGAGTLQIIPQSNFGDAPKLQFREVFQDPTATDNADNPLPQNLPFSWNFPGEADEAVVIVILDRDAWQGSGLTCRVVLQIWAEYFGPWWDADAYVLAMGQVNCDPPTTTPVPFST